MKAFFFASLSFVIMAACGRADEPRECITSASYLSKIDEKGIERITYEGDMCLDTAAIPGPNVLELRVSALENILGTSVRGFTTTTATTFEMPLPSEQKLIRIEFVRPSDGREIPAEISFQFQVQEKSR